MIYNKPRKLKILIPILTIGKEGGYRVLSELSNHWTKMGHEVCILTYHENKSPYFPINAPIIWVDEYGISREGNTEEFKSKNSGYKRAKGIYKYLKLNSEKYDIVLANHNFSVWPILMGSKTNNFYYIQAYEPEFYYGKGIKLAIQRRMAWATYYMPLTRIVNSKYYTRYKNLKSNNVVFPGLDLDIYYPKKIEVENKSCLIVGCIGRKETWKGAQDVALAVKMLQDRGLNVKLKVAFSPVEGCDHELIQPHGDKNLADYYRSLDVLVAPGHLQLGAVHYPVIEAMACNVPVITTGYYPADDKNSFIVPIKRPDKIADRLEEIYNDYSLALEKTKIAQNDILQFDWNVVSKEFIDIFIKNLK